MFGALALLCLLLGLNMSLLLLMISRATWLYQMKSRPKLFSHFSAFCAEIQTRFLVSIETLGSNNAKEHLSEPF